MCMSIAQMAKNKAISLAGKTQLGELAAVIKNLNQFIICISIKNVHSGLVGAFSYLIGSSTQKKG